MVIKLVDILPFLHRRVLALFHIVRAGYDLVLGAKQICKMLIMTLS